MESEQIDDVDILLVIPNAANKLYCKNKIE